MYETGRICAGLFCGFLNFYFAYESPIVPAVLIGKVVFFIIILLLHFCQQLTGYICVSLFLSWFPSLALISVSVPLPISLSLDYYGFCISFLWLL